jgi:hypothetical protein
VRLTIGIRVEDLHCYGFVDGDKLSAEERPQIVQFAKSFEECSHSLAELEAMDDKTLVTTAYHAMADYARGQV